MPPERNRSSNPQGRQKSCSECSKSKRRCDLRQPSCLRCSKQNHTCVYPPQPSVAGDTPASQADTPLPDALAGDDLFEFDVQNVGLLDFNFPAAAESMDALNDLLNLDAEETLPLTRSSYLPGTHFSASHISPFAKARVEYSIEQLKLAPAMMVEANCTPWSHPMLYEDHMPRCLQDAQAACALYNSRNDTNAWFVARHITDRAKEILEMPLPTAPSELLARAHALILYQIMHASSGDIRYYAQAEPTILAMEEVGISLNTIVLNELDPSEGPLPLYPSTAARAAWKAFIYRESARRTSLILFHLIALCNLLRGRFSSCSQDLIIGTSVAISAHLWNAASAFEFAVAWNEKKHYLVKGLDFTDVLEQAKCEDVDVFSKMMMTSIMGIDDVRGWCHTRGGTF